MTQPLSITKEFSLTIHKTENGSFHLTSAATPVEQWVPSLYIDHRESFFGLTAQMEENALIATPVEVVELFSGKAHPFISFSGANDDSEGWIQTFKETASVWSNPDLWSVLQLDGNMIQVNADIDVKAKVLIENAVKQKLFQAGLTMEDVPALVPFFQQGGWPIKSQSTHPSLLVALRLSEPEGLDDTWLLETVVRGKKAVYTGRQHFGKKHYQLKKHYQTNGMNSVAILKKPKQKYFHLFLPLTHPILIHSSHLH